MGVAQLAAMRYYLTQYPSQAVLPLWSAVLLLPHGGLSSVKQALKFSVIRLDYPEHLGSERPQSQSLPALRDEPAILSGAASPFAPAPKLEPQPLTHRHRLVLPIWNTPPADKRACARIRLGLSRRHVSY